MRSSDRHNEEDWETDEYPKIKLVMTGGAICLIAVICLIYMLMHRSGQDAPENDPAVTVEQQNPGNDSAAIMEQQNPEEATESRLGDESVGDVLSSDENEVIEQDDPQMAVENQAQEGEEVLVNRILTGSDAVETQEITVGIDVSKYQGTIDWAKVAATGIDFAMIRVGYRSMDTGEIVEDTNARYNLQEASANGIHVGAYFFSTAITEAEAIEEADWVAELISGYPITYPVAYNCEGFNTAASRQYGLSSEQRNACAVAFLKEIYNWGYTPMFYASKGELEGDLIWNASTLEQNYKMWVSWYGGEIYPQRQTPDYSGSCAMWQYTNKGIVDGITEEVDVNVAYFGYENAAEAHSDIAPEYAEADAEALMRFTNTDESVTAKDATNLRNIPSQGEDSKVIYTLKNGEVAHQTGVSESGWSRVEYNGETLYAVTSYLTTDLSARPAAESSNPATGAAVETDDGIKTVFTECNDRVSPKIEVNLRTLPSVTNPDSQIVVTLPYGEVVNRTGINQDYGWSRVEYNGQTLYCISSYVYVVE